MTETSATCPWVTVRGDHVLIEDLDDRMSVSAYDMDAFVANVLAAHEKLRSRGVMTGWSHDADGLGNCGVVRS